MSPQVLGQGVVNLVGLADGAEVYLAVLSFADSDPQIVLNDCTLTAGSVQAVLECLALLPPEKFSAGRSVDLTGPSTPGEASLPFQSRLHVEQLRLQGAAVLLNQ